MEQSKPNRLFLLAIDHFGGKPIGGKRTLVSVAISHDEGHSWIHLHHLLADPDGWYSYFVVYFVGDCVSLAFCATGRGQTKLSETDLIWFQAKNLDSGDVRLSPMPAGAAKPPGGSTAAADLRTLEHRLGDPQPITWLFTGDSVTQGAKWVGGDRIYSEIVFERVRWEMSRKRDIVINTAISGNKSDDILEDFAWRVSHLHPEVVSLMIGMNDSVRGRAGERQFEANLVDLVARIRALGAIPILQTTNTTMHDPERADLAAYNAIIEKVAQERKVVLVDNWKYWKCHRTLDDLRDWLGNPIHPNGRGHAAIAEEFFRTLGIYDPNSPMCKLGS